MYSIDWSPIMSDQESDTIESAVIEKRANVYYGGDVTSRSLEKPGGESVTLGVMRPGEYTFETDEREVIEVLEGELTARFGNEESHCTAGEEFVVPPSTEFQVDVVSLVDYCCTYG